MMKVAIIRYGPENWWFCPKIRPRMGMKADITQPADFGFIAGYTVDVSILFSDSVC